MALSPGQDGMLFPSIEQPKRETSKPRRAYRRVKSMPKDPALRPFSGPSGRVIISNTDGLSLQQSNSR